MYTEEELLWAAGIIRQIALQNNVPEEQARKDMREAMEAGRNNPDPAVQARWKEFHFSGDEPTVEEFILWTAYMVRRRE